MQKFEINSKLPGLNEYIDKNRANQYGGSNLKKQAEKIIIMYAKTRRLKKIKSPVYFRFIWYEKTKRRDKDNVAFAKKFILDALQKCGVLPNDNNYYVQGFQDHFVYDGKTQKVVVEIYECDEVDV